jgi:hypothetical protein
MCSIVKLNLYLLLRLFSFLPLSALLLRLFDAVESPELRFMKVAGMNLFNWFRLSSVKRESSIGVSSNVSSTNLSVYYLLLPPALDVSKMQI